MNDENLELEIKISYLEDYMNQLNDIIIDQGKKIDRLIIVNRQLHNKVVLLEDNVKEPSENTPPPHY